MLVPACRNRLEEHPEHLRRLGWVCAPPHVGQHRISIAVGTPHVSRKASRGGTGALHPRQVPRLTTFALRTPAALSEALCASEGRTHTPATAGGAHKPRRHLCGTIFCCLARTTPVTSPSIVKACTFACGHRLAAWLRLASTSPHDRHHHIVAHPETLLDCTGLPGVRLGVRCVSWHMPDCSMRAGVLRTAICAACATVCVCHWCVDPHTAAAAVPPNWQ